MDIANWDNEPSLSGYKSHLYLPVHSWHAWVLWFLWPPVPSSCDQHGTSLCRGACPWGRLSNMHIAFAIFMAMKSLSSNGTQDHWIIKRGCTMATQNPKNNSPNQGNLDFVPEEAPQKEEKLHFILTGLTKKWCRNWDSSKCSTELGDQWLAVLSQLPEDFHSWAEKTFNFTWGYKILPDLIADLVHGELEAILDEAFTSVAWELPRYACMQRANWFAGRLEFAATPYTVEPHRPVHRGTANEVERIQSQQDVPRLFGQQDEWQNRLRKCRLDVLPEEINTPLLREPDPLPQFLIVHLFSGRRRATDCHAQLNRYAEKMRMRFVILSLDTAVSLHYGNLEYASTSWQQLEALYTQGLVAASICGSPCETFTEARFQAPPDDALHPERWPRPLRSFARLFGLENLTHREMRQLRAGSAFFLQVVMVLPWQVTSGGLFIAEHPATPRDRERPSIWTSALLELFQTHPDIKLYTLKQRQWGAKAVKPTGLLTLRLPHFFADMKACEDPTPDEQIEAAIGKDERTNEFCTAKFKEYPAAFCDGLSHAIAAQLRRCWIRKQCRFSEPNADLLSWIHEAAQASSTIRTNACWLPDYQGQ